MALFANAIEKASAELRKLAEARATLEERAVDAAGELERLRAGAGETELASILEGLDAGPTRSRMVELDAQLRGLDAARGPLAARLAGAYRALQKARADEIRGKAEKVREQLSKHVAARDKLLAALEEHEGCPFCPLARAQQAEQEAITTRGALRMGGPAVIKMPKSQSLAQEVARLLAEADSLEKRMPPTRDSVSGETLPELLAVCDNTDKLAPTRQAIEKWHAEAARAAEAHWERSQHQSHIAFTPPRRVWFTVVWEGGVILREESGWQQRGVTERDLSQAAEHAGA